MRRRRKGRDLLKKRMDGRTDDAMSGFREPVRPIRPVLSSVSVLRRRRSEWNIANSMFCKTKRKAKRVLVVVSERIRECRAPRAVRDAFTADYKESRGGIIVPVMVNIVSVRLVTRHEGKRRVYPCLVFGVIRVLFRLFRIPAFGRRSHQLDDEEQAERRGNKSYRSRDHRRNAGDEEPNPEQNFTEVVRVSALGVESRIAPARLTRFRRLVVELGLIRHGFERDADPLQRQTHLEKRRKRRKVDRVRILRVPENRRRHHRVQRAAKQNDHGLFRKARLLHFGRLFCPLSPFVPRHRPIPEKPREASAVSRRTSDVCRQQRGHERTGRRVGVRREPCGEQHAQAVTDAERVDWVDVRQHHRRRARTPERGEGIVRRQHGGHLWKRSRRRRRRSRASRLTRKFRPIHSVL